MSRAPSRAPSPVQSAIAGLVDLRAKALETAAARHPEDAEALLDVAAGLRREAKALSAPTLEAHTVASRRQRVMAA